MKGHGPLGAESSIIARKQGYQIGGRFNPKTVFVGRKRFYTRDAITRAREIDGKKVRSSHKQVYDRIERFADPKTGKSCVDYRTLAGELGMSDKQVKRLVKDLENMSLLGHDWRDGDRRNSYFFLWHLVLEQALGEFEGTFMSPQNNEGSGEFPQFEGTFSQFEGTSMSQETSKPSLETTTSASERKVQKSSSQEILNEAHRPPAQSQKTNGSHSANGRGHHDPQQGSSKAETEKTGNTQDTPNPSPAAVDAVRAALKQATGRESTADDTLPTELLQRARNHGANEAVLRRWILDLAEAKLRRGDPVVSHGFFRTVLDKELPGWMRRNARVVDVLIPRALGRGSVDVDSIIADEKARSSGPGKNSAPRWTPIGTRRPEEAGFWKPPRPPAPPKCPDCRDIGTVERGNKTVRCLCPAGPKVPEDCLRLANKLRGRQNARSGKLQPSAVTPQGTNGSGFKRITTEDIAQAVTDHRVKKAAAASAIRQQTKEPQAV